MRMRFTGEDEDAYVRARDELVERFAAWGRRRGVPAAPADVELLLDLRYEHGDGVLDDWTIGDVEEFLLEWCPQVLSAASDDVDGLPGSVAAWVQFLAEEGLLADRSDAPERIREYCAGVAVPFRAALADQGVEAVELPASIGPLRMPRPDEIAESIHAGQALRMARALALFCAAPGRKLTPEGNLRVADARELVTVLDTGDDVERGGYAAVRSVAELPGVWTWVRIGLAAGAVRRQNGRLVAVTRFTKLDDIAAHDALVRAAFAGSLPIDDGDVLATAVGAATDHLLAMLLDGPADGVMAIHAVGSVVAAALEVRAGIVDELVPGIFERIVDLLTGVDLVTVGTRLCPDCPDPHPVFDLTAAGAPHAVERVRAAGVEVTVLPEPAEASAAELVAGVEAAGPGFTADVAAWLSVQRTRTLRSTSWAPRSSRPIPSG